MKMYKTVKWNARVDLVEIERKTEHSVWINGSRRAMRTDYESYFDSFDEAKNYLLGIEQKNLSNAKARLDAAVKKIEKLEAMTEAYIDGKPKV